MAEISGKVKDDIRHEWDVLKWRRHDTLNGPLLATLIHSAYSRLTEAEKKKVEDEMSASLKAQKEEPNE